MYEAQVEKNALYRLSFCPLVLFSPSGCQRERGYRQQINKAKKNQDIYSRTSGKGKMGASHHVKNVLYGHPPGV